MAAYSLNRFPLTLPLHGGVPVTVRPMTGEDEAGLLAFFQRIPESERYFLKDDVASAEVVHRFVEELDYGRALPLLALLDGRIVANAVLIRHRGGYLAHKGEIRVLIDPEQRGSGLGVMLMTELATIAWDAGLDHVEFQFIRGIQDDAIAAAEFVGAFTVGTATEYVKDRDGILHDLVFLRIPLGKWWQWSRF